MKKYNSIAEIEADQKQQKRKQNRAIIAAMTDNELLATLDMIYEERGLRKKDKEAEDKKRLENMSEGDFIRGRVFGIKENIRKGIVVKKDARYVNWRWVSSEPGEGTVDTISDLMYWITWLGGIELEHLTEAEGIEPLHT